MRTRSALAIAAAVLALGVSPPPTHAATPASPFDFDGDGFGDVAIAAPRQQVGDIGRDGGSVNVIYGSSSGLTATGDQLWTLDSPGVKGLPTKHSEYGHGLTSADFDADGYADLAVAVSFATYGGRHHAGLVSILYGSAAGLTADRDQLWAGDELTSLPDLPGQFGWSIAAADLDADGYADLIAGAPGTSIGGVSWTGSVVVLAGGPSGLTSSGIASYDLASTTGVPGEQNQGFGVGVEAADVDGDGNPELIAAVPYWGTFPDQGALVVIHGTPDGPDAEDADLVRLSDFGYDDDAVGDVGRVMATGDVNADGFADLAFGMSTRTVATCDCSAGTVYVLYGDAHGLGSEGVDAWSQDSPGVPGVAEGWELFGGALTIGDANGDGTDDLAIGSPSESVRDIDEMGSATVLLGSVDGLTAVGAHVVTQATNGVPSAPETGDRFGSSLSLIDVGRSGAADLVVGSMGEDVGSVEDAGYVNVLYGSSAGATGQHAQGWSQDSPGIKGTAERSDLFGVVGR